MRTLLLSILFTLLASTGWSQGIPFIRNYSATEYGGNNQNFDIMTGKDGIVYVANFEGLLYYDHAEWHMLHTPGVTRITALFRDSKGTIWTGGYNYIGYIEISANGSPMLHSIDKKNVFRGEVQWIWERDGAVYFLVSDKEVYTIRNKNNVVWAAGAKLPTTGPSTFIGEAHVNQVQQLGDYNLQALATDGEGVVFQYKDGKEIFRITEDNGLCSNNVRYVTYDDHGLIWGATDNGIFGIGFPSVYTHLTAKEGLRGEVLSLIKYQQALYAGTQYGLFRMQGKSFVQLPEITYACWQLEQHGDDLLAATADGIYRINANHQVSQLTTNNTLSLLVVEDGFYSGEADGIFFYNLESEALEEPFEECRFARGCIGSIIDNDRQLWIGCLEGAFLIDIGKGKDKSGRFSFQHLRDKLDNPSSGIIDKITCFYQSSDGTLWIGSNGYGLYKRVTGNDGKDKFVAYTTNDGLANNAVKGIVEDNVGKLWIATGNGLSVLNPQTGAFTTLGEADGLLCQQFYWNGATRGKEGTLWFGCQGGLVRLESGKMAQVKAPQLHLTHLTIDNQDAVAGDGHIDEDICYAEEVRLHESNKSLVFDFSALNYGHETQGVYSYRMKGLEEEWAQLAPGQHSVRYTSLPSGDYVFEVRYASALSNAESTVSVKVSVSPYFYKSWWFITLLLLALLAAAVAFYKNRVRQLRRQEEEKLMQPIEEALRESEDPVALQKRIQGIIDNRNRMTASVNKTAVADDQQAALSQIPFMDRVMELMEQNYMNSEYGVTELSEQMGVNRTLLSKKLNEETGMSPGQFIRHYRLDMARKLLERNTANRNIAEIAFSVGFNDPKYFTRCFTKEFGVSPSSFGKN